MSIVEFSIGL